METLYRIFVQNPEIEKDTRKNLKGKIYWALKGERFDGNNFVKEALEKGAVHAVSSDKKWLENPQVTVVEDTLITLQQLANYHRKQTKARIIAVTGSNGKTTTKELMFSVLKTRYKTIATEGNLNNHIGVPLTLLKIRPETEMAIVEMGINHFGELENLCQIAEPDFGYITSFGEAHLEFFGDIQGVIKAKTELYRFLKKTGGTVFLNFDDPVQVEYSEGLKRFGFSYEKHPQAQVLLEKVKTFPVNELKYKNLIIKSQLYGEFHFNNIGGAVVAGDYFGIEPEKIKVGIENYKARNNRTQWVDLKNTRILLDAYNANPTSMKAALKGFARLPGKKTAVLGDMLELGSKSLEKHQEIVNYLEELKIPAYLIGHEFMKTSEHDFILGKFRHIEEFKNQIKPEQFPGQTILIKGSRGMTLEKWLD